MDYRLAYEIYNYFFIEKERPSVLDWVSELQNNILTVYLLLVNLMKTFEKLSEKNVITVIQ